VEVEDDADDPSLLHGTTSETGPSEVATHITSIALQLHHIIMKPHMHASVTFHPMVNGGSNARCSS